MAKAKIPARDMRALFLFQYKKGLNASAAAREINQVFGEDVCNERTVRRWYTNFIAGNFDLQNEPRGRPISTINDDELRSEVERNPAATLQNLAEIFNVSTATISRHLDRIGRVKHLDGWVADKLASQEINASEKVENTTVETIQEASLENTGSKPSIKDKHITPSTHEFDDVDKLSSTESESPPPYKKLKK